MRKSIRTHKALAASGCICPLLHQQVLPKSAILFETVKISAIRFETVCYNTRINPLVLVGRGPGGDRGPLMLSVANPNFCPHKWSAS